MGLNDWAYAEARKTDLALTGHYHIAQDACEKAMKILALGPTNQGLCYWLMNWTNKAIFETERHKRLVEIRNEYEKKFKETGLYNDLISNLLKKEMLPLIAAYAEKAQTGACGEYGAVVFEYLKNNRGGGMAFNIEFVRCKGHYVVVINRDFGTDLTAPNSWNTTAYICDPWNRKVWTWNEYANPMMFRYIPEAALSLPHNGTPYLRVADWLNW